MWSVFHVLVSNLAAGLHSNCSWARNDWLIQVYSTLQLSWSSCVSLPFSLSLSTGLSVCLFVCHTLPGRFGIPSNFLSSILAPEAIKLTCLSSTDQPVCSHAGRGPSLSNHVRETRHFWERVVEEILFLFHVRLEFGSYKRTFPASRFCK